MPAVGLTISLLAGVVALAVTFLILRNAQRLGVVQVPNERSSHAIPTPSGGGIGIVAGGTIGALLVAWHEPWPAVLVLMASLIVAAIGFLDDRRPIRPAFRLGAQLVLFGAVVLTLPLPQLAAAPGLPLPVPLLVPLLVLGGVYWINLFNFMDGIDGLAASEALFMLLGAALLALGTQGAAAAPEFWWIVALAVSGAAFLLLNWPPARIFMGDAGSTYLGFMQAFFALDTVASGWLTPWQWLILGAVFLTDATVTLLRRLLNGERIFEAHRRHAYQVLSRRWGGHRPVTLACIAVNIVWLWPLAYLAGLAPEFGWLVASAAYVPLIVAALAVGAGAPEKKSV